MVPQRRTHCDTNGQLAGNSTPPLAARRRMWRGKVGCTYLRLKDLNAVVRVHERATQKVSRGITDRQTN